MGDVSRIYTPKLCQGEGALFDGHVLLKVPSYEDRLEMLAEYPDLINEENEAESDKKISKAGMKTMLTMIRWSYQFYLEVKITRLSDKQKFKSLDDLRYSSDCQGIIQDVATNLSKGFVLGK